MRYLLVVLALACVGCGSAPTSPSPQPSPAPTPAPTPAPAPAPAPAPSLPNITGSWTGGLALTFQGQRGTVQTRATLQQSAEAINGTWSITTANNDAFGTITGRLRMMDSGAWFDGIVTWSVAADGSGTRCLGQTGFSGPSTGTALSWTAPTVDFGGTCQSALSDLAWTLAR